MENQNFERERVLRKLTTNLKPGVGKYRLANNETFSHNIGNRVLQQIIAQCSSQNQDNLEEEAVVTINHERPGGRLLDQKVIANAGKVFGEDFSSVHVHTSPVSNLLNLQLNSRAFTTGNDIFFREGEYQPHTSEGQKLIAHELTHVVQQASGALWGSSDGKMTVNPPGDRYEQEADAVASAVVREINAPPVQQRGSAGKEDQQMQPLQREIGAEEDDDLLQRQEAETEEEEDLP